jgi:dTDP-4-dehydrorhamnose 3,5-epimerase
LINHFRFGAMRPALVVVPPKVWHGVQNIGPSAALLINAVDKAYQYEGPDHWRLPADSADVPFKFDSYR